MPAVADCSLSRLDSKRNIKAYIGWERKGYLLNKENETYPNRITAEEHNQSWSDMNYT